MNPRRSLCRSLRTLALFAATASSASWAEGSITGKVEATPPKYLAETVVYVKQASGSFPKKTLTMDQQGMKFIPHVLAVTVGDTVSYLNHDAVTHNVLSPDDGNYNLGNFSKGESRSHTFDKEGAYSQLCSIHPEMLAYVFVSQNPYHAVVDASGHYKIDHVPPGTYQVEIWNSHLKAAPQTVTVAAGAPAHADFGLKR
jgi:plastocyanin